MFKYNVTIYLSFIAIALIQCRNCLFSSLFNHEKIIQSGNPLERNASDAAALAAKVAKKEAMKKHQEEVSGQALSNKPIVRKKVQKKEDVGLDDLLNAGLKKKQ